MKSWSVAAVCVVIVCALAAGASNASAQGLGAGLHGKADPAQVQQNIQEQTQQRIQAQAEAQARVRAEAQAQQAAARMQQRVEAQAQNQAARAQAQGERALGAVQQRLDAATQQRTEAGVNANSSTGLRVGPQTVRTKTQAEIDAEAGSESAGPFFGPWNPFRATTGAGGSANARNRGDAGARPSDQTPTEGETSEEEAKRSSPGLRVGQVTDFRGTARAELARSMALRLTAISAMRDRAIEAEDLQLLEKADRLEDAVRRALDARARGQVDAQAEAAVNAELPVPPVQGRVDSAAQVAPTATSEPTTQP
ncbi:MAG TPA: hypothetical protein VGN57_13875 [Pirellulaceae bacterium]|jgi:hypothetical protein|nr:hypothetical protein [Pirellulaceae bacterium]